MPEAADKPSARVENRPAAAATGSLSSPRKAQPQSLAATDTCAAYLPHADPQRPLAAMAPASPTVRRSNRSDTCAQLNRKIFPRIFLPRFLREFLNRFLEAYIDQQWPLAHHTEKTPLLGTVKLQRITRNTAEEVFKKLREEAGVHRPREARYQPRLHDFRHSFALVRIVTWYREGKNVQRLLPHLTTYLGHGSIQDTAHYLTMATELLTEASLCFERYARPEVSLD